MDGRPIEVTGQTARSLVSRPLPRLYEGRRKTTTDSTHNLYYNRTLVEWTGFEMEVRRAFQNTRWTDEVLAFHHHDITMNHINHEQLLVGDEHSVVARWGQNLGHVMTSVYQSLGIRSRFADWKVCSDNLLGYDVPDIVIFGESSGLQVLGEGKTPWMHNIKAQVGKDKNFRHYLGQIANYMYLGKVKYGFLTTYDQTIFLKQAPLNSKRGEWALWYSNVILNTTRSTPVDGVDLRFKYRHEYHGKVSLRECFLFLGQEIQSGKYRVENTTDSKLWVGTSYKPRKHLFDDDHISDAEEYSGSDSSSHESLSGTTTRERGRGTTKDARKGSRSAHIAASGPTTRSRSTREEELVSRTAGLSLTDRSTHPESRSFPLTNVYLDGRQYYTTDPRGRSIPVSLFQGRDGRYYYDHGEDRYEANIVQYRPNTTDSKHEKRRK